MNRQEKNTTPRVPKLRFPEFRDAAAWGDSQLQKCAVFVGEKISLSGLSSSCYVSTENLLPDYGGISKTMGLPSVNSVTRFIENDILISNIRPYLKKVWLSDRSGGASNDVIVVRAGEDLDYRFLSLILKNDTFIASVMQGAKGVKMPRGDVAAIKEYNIYYPDKSSGEQQKIADCLSSLDDLIAAQAGKIEALRAHKKGLMQLLFPAEGQTLPQLRFPEFRDAPGWYEDTLSNLINTVTPPEKLQTSAYNSNGRFPIIDQSLNEQAGWTDNKLALISKPLPLIVFGDHTCNLKIARRPFAQGADGIKIFYGKQCALTEYLFQYLQYDPVKMEEYKRHFSILKEKKIRFPEIETGEQQKIANCLSSLDELIAAQAGKVEALRAHKKGLMQRLFPSFREDAA